MFVLETITEATYRNFSKFNIQGVGARLAGKKGKGSLEINTRLPRLLTPHDLENLS